MADNLQDLSWNSKNYNMYSGIQLDSRKPTSYGMYVFKGWLNVDNQPTVAGLFLQSIQPPPSYYPELNEFWRWTEIDWEYVPYTEALFQERLSCTGDLPNVNCKLTPCPQADGELTADGKAKVIGKLSGRTDIKNWDQLLSQTKGLNNIELLQKIKIIENYDSLDKWSDFLYKIKDSSKDELANTLGKLLLIQPDIYSDWFSFINNVKLEPSESLAGKMISLLGHTDVIDLTQLISKISQFSKNEFARQIGIVLKIKNSINNFDELAKELKSVPKAEIEKFPQKFVSETGIGKALVGKDSVEWKDLAVIINNIPLNDFKTNLNTIIEKTDDFAKVNFINWEQFILKVISSVLGKDTNEISSIDQLYEQISDLSNKEFIQEMSEAIEYTPNVVNYDTLMEDDAVRDKEPWWTAGANWGMPTGEKAQSSDGKIMTINFWRVPEGPHKIKVDNIEASFIPTVSTSFSGFVTTNSQYFTVKDKQGKFTYDPKELHTYTIVWTPESLQFYLDAENNGTDIDNATPIKFFDAQNYPGIKMTGNQYPGGDKTFWWYGTEKKLGDVLIMLNHWFGEGWSGYPNQNFIKSSSYISKVSYFPLYKADAHPKNIDFVYQNDDNIIDIDFSTMPNENWRYQLLKEFVPEVTGDFINQKIEKNPQQMDLVQVPGTDQQALELRLSRYDDEGAKQKFFYVVLDAPKINKNGVSENQKILVTIDNEEVGVYVNLTNVNVINIEAFWASVGSEIEIHAKNLGSGVENTCKIQIQENLVWSFNGAHDCQHQDENLQFLNKEDALAVTAQGNTGRIPIHWHNFHGIDNNDNISENTLNDHDEL